MEKVEKKDNRVILGFFVLYCMMVFYGLVIGGFGFILYLTFATMVSYFVIYPEKFFHMFHLSKNVVSSIENKLNLNNAINKNNKVSNISIEEYRQRLIEEIEMLKKERDKEKFNFKEDYDEPDNRTIARVSD